MKTKAEIAGIWLQAKEHQGLLTIVQSEESVWDTFYPRASQRSVVPLALFLKVLFMLLLFLAMRGLCCCAGFSLVAVSRGHSLVVVNGLLIGAAPLVAEHGLQACGLQ